MTFLVEVSVRSRCEQKPALLYCLLLPLSSLTSPLGDRDPLTDLVHRFSAKAGFTIRLRCIFTLECYWMPRLFLGLHLHLVPVGPLKGITKSLGYLSPGIAGRVRWADLFPTSDFGGGGLWSICAESHTEPKGVCVLPLELRSQSGEYNSFILSFIHSTTTS